MYKNALVIYQKVRGPKHPDTAVGLNNLAVLYQDMGDYAKAEPLCKEALEIRQQALGPEHRDTAASLNNLATLYKEMGDYAKAEPLFKEALEIHRKVLGEHPDMATSLCNLAVLYQNMGDYAKAEPLFKEALDIFQKIFGLENPYTVGSLNDLAYLEVDLGRSKEASAFARSASDARQSLLSKMFSFSSERRRLAYMADLDPYSLFALLPGCQADLTLALLRYKGLVLDSVIEDRRLAQASTNAEDHNWIERLMADQRQLDRLLLKAPEKLSKTSGQVEQLEEDVEAIEGQLAQRVAGLGQARRALGVTVDQVQACIPADCALIEYVRYRSYVGKGKSEAWYGALVLLQKGDPRWIPLGNVAKVDELVTRFNRLASVEDADDDELAANLKALYEAVWASVGQQLPPGTHRLIISPDGQLNFVSFATLITPQGGFLAENFKVQYIVSGRELLQDRPPAAKHNVILFADPAFGTNGAAGSVPRGERSASQPMTQWRGNEKRCFQRLHFDPLPGALAESELLLRFFRAWRWPNQSYTGRKATKEALLEVRSPFILHLATHGFFEPQDLSENESGSADRKPSVFQSKFFANPMHQSGLALSGANLTLGLWDQGHDVGSVDNDGIMTAEDISTLDLQGHGW